MAGPDAAEERAIRRAAAQIAPLTAQPVIRPKPMPPETRFDPDALARSPDFTPAAREVMRQYAERMKILAAKDRITVIDPPSRD